MQMIDTGKNKKRTGPSANSFCLVNIFKGKNFVFFSMYLESLSDSLTYLNKIHQIV